MRPTKLGLLNIKSSSSEPKSVVFVHEKNWLKIIALNYLSVTRFLIIGLFGNCWLARLSCEVRTPPTLGLPASLVSTRIGFGFMEGTLVPWNTRFSKYSINYRWNLCGKFHTPLWMVRVLVAIKSKNDCFWAKTGKMGPTKTALAVGTHTYKLFLIRL